ncbi:MAG: PhoH family protein [Burkholderiaceae bacterium]|nr:PhoH family protein [Burkholderiaceae bacterium]MCD8538219.1 PhoH family protein [Burkholderiaceae bacterium]MCD8565757.1 PhoH family protein [Burkholderiaceae bacterium]
MPLPKLPSRPATLLDLSTVAEPKPAIEPKKVPTLVTPVTPVAKDITNTTASNPSALLTPVPTTAKLETRPTKPVASHAVKQPAASSAKKGAKSRRAVSATTTKLFVLDTNVLMHDPTSLFRFEEHDVYLPMMTLEELDHHKKGMSEVARNARQVSRSLDALVEDLEQIDQGIELNRLGNKDAIGKLFFQTTALANHLPDDLPMGKADNQILGVVSALQRQFADREVVLVSKDINMRLKARALGLAAEDYFNDHVLEDTDLLYTGAQVLPEDFWNKHGKDIESWQQGGITFYRIKGPLCSQFLVNQFVYFDGSMPLHAQVREVSGKTAVLATLRDYTHAKNNVWGITARNREQNFAMNLLMDPDVDFVSLLGQAGTGKTLLTLAAALTQVLETKRYTEIIMTRVTVPVGEDIGFLPGTEEEKMLPWMGALEDNLDVLNMGDGDGNSSGNDWGRAATMDLIRSRIKVKSLNFMRGRTFLNKFLIIDEAQNLTPKQMKTLITRAGPGTKVVCLGNIAQIDTPYLTEGSSGLTFVVDRFKGWPHAGHITLQRGERSRLADYAGDVL